MSVVAFASVAGAPGVTAAAVAAAVHWPRPVLLVEADTNSAASLMTGFFRANLDSNAGMHQVSLALSRGALNLDALLDPAYGISIAVHELPPIPSMPIPALPAGHRLWTIPGYRDLQIIGGVRAVWERLPVLLAQADELGIDAIVDLGRLQLTEHRLLMLDASDQVVVLASSTMTDLNRLHKRLQLPDLEERLDGIGRSKYSTLLVKAPAEAVTAADFARATLPVLGLLPFDSDGAAVFALGREDPRPNRNQYRAAIRGAVSSLDDRLRATTERKAS